MKPGFKLEFKNSSWKLLFGPRAGFRWWTDGRMDLCGNKICFIKLFWSHVLYGNVKYNQSLMNN